MCIKKHDMNIVISVDIQPQLLSRCTAHAFLLNFDTFVTQIQTHDVSVAGRDGR